MIARYSNKRSLACFLFMAASPCVAAEQPAPGRYQLHVLSPSEAVVIDTQTGCLDRVRFFDTREVVEPVTGYPDADKFEEALRSTTKSNANADGLDAHSCVATSRQKSRKPQ